MSKYIVKNCKSLISSGICELYSQKGIHLSSYIYCKDKNCLLKQIVELCKKENVEGEKLASIMRLSNKDTKEFLSRFASNKILELLDIQEVE